MSADPNSVLEEALLSVGDLFVQLRLLRNENEQLRKQLLRQADPFETGQAAQKDVSHGD